MEFERKQTVKVEVTTLRCNMGVRYWEDGDVQAADVTPIGYAGIATASLARVEFDVAQSLDA